MNCRGWLRAAIPRPISWKLKHARLAFWNERNFGDLFSAEVVHRIFGIRTQYSGFGAADLIAVGSLLELAEERVTSIKPTVWGTGFIRDGGIWAGPPMDFRAVRGRKTLKRIEKFTQRKVALGDPGILVAHVYPHLANVKKNYTISVIPHFHEMDEPILDQLQSDSVHIIDPRDEPVNVAAQIAASECIFSSSLHGLIFSDGLNVPNAWTPISNRLAGGEYKFRDYYSAYGIDPQPQSLNQALDTAFNLVQTWKPRPEIYKLKKNLVSAFPMKPIQPIDI